MMNKFNKALVNAEIEKQNKEAKKNAKRAYINDLVKQGIDKEMAKVMANTFFEYGLVKAM